MRSTLLIVALLWLTAFSLILELEPHYRSALSPSGRSSDALALLLGDSRELFAKHLYAKADAYFHSGYYPTIFDQKSDELHLSNSPSHPEDAHAEEGGWLGQPKDWLDRFGRHFYPTDHKHLGELSHEEHDESGHDHDGDGHQDHDARDHKDHDEHDHDAGHHEKSPSPPREDGELLPWLRLSASLDPQQPQTYVVASFWLRSQLGKVREAEQFLREGLRNNPGDPELLFELGRIHRENHKDNERARNIWEIALKNWRQRSPEVQEQNRLFSVQLLVNLAQIEDDSGNFRQAIDYLKDLAPISPNKERIEEWIAELSKRNSL